MATFFLNAFYVFLCVTMFICIIAWAYQARASESEVLILEPVARLEVSDIEKLGLAIELMKSGLLNANDVLQVSNALHVNNSHNLIESHHANNALDTLKANEAHHAHKANGVLQ